jgi:hypothetical protein
VPGLLDVSLPALGDGAEEKNPLTTNNPARTIDNLDAADIGNLQTLALQDT